MNAPAQPIQALRVRLAIGIHVATVIAGLPVVRHDGERILCRRFPREAR